MENTAICWFSVKKINTVAIKKREEIPWPVNFAFMCFKAAKDADLNKINKDFAVKVNKKIRGVENFKAAYVLSAFSNDYLPVFRQPDLLEFFSWGFIQPTAQDNRESAEIKYNTANAKCETIFEKPLYRDAILEKRCIITIDGFFEWRHVSGKTYPHYIYNRSGQTLLAGGIWNEWVNPQTGEIKETVSMITTAANPLMETIHNRKKRMPLILDDFTAQEWLNTDLRENQLMEIMRPYPEEKMSYHTVGRNLLPFSEKTIEKTSYPELENEQQSLF